MNNFLKTNLSAHSKFNGDPVEMMTSSSENVALQNLDVEVHLATLALKLEETKPFPNNNSPTTSCTSPSLNEKFLDAHFTDNDAPEVDPDFAPPVSALNSDSSNESEGSGESSDGSLQYYREEENDDDEPVEKSSILSGKPYTDVKGNLKPGRELISIKECTKCRFKCSTLISPENRKEIHKDFWNLNDDQKLHFFNKNVQRLPKALKRTQ
ncbi:unnamed protein product [Brassicogethes aeneus]|uniref:Uncharacterized protein n=1 Tax=Brassicogethes aeneus TaxID=1431903 RepID=A0A9P0ARX7_BRAAE|nr:unnamed protein product [Brassicogethes aeneus]